MKRMIIAVVVFTILCACVAQAADAEKKEFSSTTFLYGDSIHVDGKDRAQYWAKTAMKYKGIVMVGFEGSYAPTGNYTLTRPFAGPVVGPVAFIAGYSYDSNRKESVFGGVKYGGRFENLDWYVDSRIYSPLNNARPVWDTFYESTYRIGSVRAGVNVIHDKYLDGDKMNYVLIGPIVYVDIGKGIQAFGRIATEPIGTGGATSTRAGLMFAF